MPARGIRQLGGVSGVRAGDELAGTEHPDEVLDVEQDGIRVGSVVLGELDGDTLKVGLAVEGEPDGGARAVEVVQVLAVEEHGLTGEQDPVDAVGASVARGAGGCRLGGVWTVARGPEAVERPSAR